MLWLTATAAAGMAAGALIAHSLLLVLMAFAALGPIVSWNIGRRAGGGWWLWVMAYSMALGFGIYLFPDGQTVVVGDWRTPLSACVLTAVAGILPGLFSHPL